MGARPMRRAVPRTPTATGRTRSSSSERTQSRRKDRRRPVPTRRIGSTAMLDRDLAEEVLRRARRRGGSFAELFVEERRSTAIRLDDGRVEELTSGRDRGAGVRVAQGISYGYAFSNRLDREALLAAAEAASAALRDGGAADVIDLTDATVAEINRVE